MYFYVVCGTQYVVKRVRKSIQGQSMSRGTINFPTNAPWLSDLDNYGADAFYLGTANPMNLMTDLADDEPEGGWELLQLVELGHGMFLPLVVR